MNNNKMTYYIEIYPDCYMLDEGDVVHHAIEDLRRYKVELEEAKINIKQHDGTPERTVPAAPATGRLRAPKTRIGGYATKAMMLDEIDKRIQIISKEIVRQDQLLTIED